MNKIVITGDLLRLSMTDAVPSQNHNIGLFASLHAPACSGRSRRPVSIVRSLSAEGFDVAAFYRMVGIKPEASSWGAIYNSRELPDAAFNYLASFLDADLVVGFEIPTVMKNVITAIGGTYIDATLHPIRFGEELILAVSTNDRIIRDRMKKYSFGESEHFVEAEILRSNFSVPRAAGERTKRVALICGQTYGDRVTLNADNQFSRIEDFIGRIADLADNYDEVLYRRHPYVVSDVNTLLMFSTIENIKFTSENFYELLSIGAVDDVYSMSSGTSYESKYFGVPGHFLLKMPYWFSEVGCSENSTFSEDEEYISLKGWMLSEFFWDYLLTGDESRVGAPPRFSTVAPYRTVFKQNWGRDVTKSA